MRKTNTMTDPIQKCAACGSSRVASGKLDGDEEGGILFKCSESNGRALFTLSHVPLGVFIRQEGVRMCVDCGKVTAWLSVDMEEAKKVLSQWGTDGLKSRLAIGPPAP